MKAFFGKIWAWVLANKVLAAIIAGGTAVVLAVAIAVPCGVSASKKRKAAQEQETQQSQPSSGGDAGGQGGSQSGDQGGQQGGGQQGGHTTHTWATAWSHDETNHWHACTGCTEKNDVEAHKFGAWTIVSETKEERTCSTCGYKEEKAHAHTFADGWSHDETNHWHASTCGHNVKSGEAAHTFGDWVIVGANEERECTVCGYKEQKVHVHSYDEHGICTGDGHYRGETKTATEAEKYLMQNLTADTAYYFRLAVEKNVLTEVNWTDNPHFSLTESKLWIKDGSNWQDVSENIVFNLPVTSDGYIYFKYVPDQDIGSISVWTHDHEHGYVDQHGFCSECQQYTGSPLQLNHTLTIESTTAATWYYARVTGLDPQEKYSLEVTSTIDDLLATYYCWSTNDQESFIEYDPFNVTSVLGGTELYLAYRSEVNDNHVQFLLTTAHNPDNAGYCQACGEFVGEDCIIDSMLPMKGFDENTDSFFRFEVAQDDIYRLTFGGEFTGTTTFYVRSLDGLTVTQIFEYPDIAFIMPEAPDGYLYVKVHVATDQVAVNFGLQDVSSYGFLQNGTFIGKQLNHAVEYQDVVIPALNTNQRFFMKFDVESYHTYKFTNFGGYEPAAGETRELFAYAHDSESDDYVLINMQNYLMVGDRTNVSLVGGTHSIDFVVVVFAPQTNRGGSSVTFRIQHGNDNQFHPASHDNLFMYCAADGYFYGDDITFNEVTNFELDDDEGIDNLKYRFPIEMAKRYRFDGTLDEHYSFYRRIDENTFAKLQDDTAWDGSVRLGSAFAQTCDGYIYIVIRTTSQGEVHNGNFTITIVD